MLVDKRVDPNIGQTGWKTTPLVIASLKNKTVVKNLLKYPKPDAETATRILAQVRLVTAFRILDISLYEICTCFRNRVH